MQCFKKSSVNSKNQQDICILGFAWLCQILTVVSIFIESVLALSDAARWLVLALVEANRYISTRKICFSITLL